MRPPYYIKFNAKNIILCYYVASRKYMKKEFEKQFASSLSVFSNSLIIVLKLIAGVVSGSISIISEAIHSTSDLLASVLTFFAVKKSSHPADKGHPFGHGRYEDVAGFLEGILIVLASFFILFEAGKRILSGSSLELDSTAGIVVMGISAVMNLFVSRYLLAVAQKTDSVALRADANHLSTDVYSSLGILAGFILIKLTNITLLDPLIAIVVALIILKTGVVITKESLNNLVDGTLPDEDIKKIENVLDNCQNIYGYKNLRSRKSGQNRDIDITLLCEGDMSLKECHKICDSVEEKIKLSLPNTEITIHCEPFLNK